MAADLNAKFRADLICDLSVRNLKFTTIGVEKRQIFGIDLNTQAVTQTVCFSSVHAMKFATDLSGQVRRKMECSACCVVSVKRKITSLARINEPQKAIRHGQSRDRIPFEKRIALAMLALVVLISIGRCMIGINAFFDQERTPVPMIINFTAKNHVLEVQAERAPGGEAHELDLLLRLKRPNVVKGFAWFVNSLMIMMMMMALCSVIVAFNVAYRGKKLKPNLLVWMSALLFVLPSLRATLPGAPPIGALTDFLVFFWVEGAIALCLFILVLTCYGRVPDNAAEK